MRDTSLLIATLGVILACTMCSSHPQGTEGKIEPVRMASRAHVVRTYRNAESTAANSPKPDKSSDEYQVYQGVMGKPGVDFPTYANIPATSFSCRGVKKSGYYADLATDCQVFHVCDGNRKISFLCPNGTIFRQSHLICDWWFRVDCGKSVELYEESAEQLEADQKIYRARAEERERRRKLAKTLVAENGGEVSSSEVFGLDDTLKKNSPVRLTANFNAGTSRQSSYKPERHSKKISNNGEVFANQYRGKGNGKVAESKEVNPSDNQSGVTFSYNRESEGSAQKFGVPQQPAQNIYDRENIQGAESGSLVEDLANRSRKNNLGGNEHKEINEFKSRKNSEYEGQKATHKSRTSNNRGKTQFKNGERFDLLNEDRQQAIYTTTLSPNSNNFYNQQNLNVGKGKEQNVNYNTYQTYENNNQNSGNKNNYQNANFAYSIVQSSLGNTNLEKESKTNNYANSANSGQGNNQDYSNYRVGQISETTVGGANFGGNPTAESPRNSNTNNPSYNDYTTTGTTYYDDGVKSTNFEYGTSQSPQNLQSNLGAENNFTFFTTNTEAERITVTGSEENTATFAGDANPTTLQNFDSTKPTVSQNVFGFGQAPQNTEENLRTETTVYNGNINFNYNNNRDSSWFEYNKGKNTDSSKDRNESTERVAPTYTTNNLNYNEKQTSAFGGAQETIVPTAQTRKSHSSRYRTSTYPYEEQQSFGQSPSFESSRRGKTYSEIQNQFQTQNKDVFKTTYRSPTSTEYYTTKAPSSEEEYTTVTEFIKTTYHWPVKKNSKKVTFAPGTEAQTFFPTTKKPTTLPPSYDTTTINAFTADEIYFTTATPGKETEFIDEYSSLQEGTTKFDSGVPTTKADVDITLQELDITKTTTPTSEKNKTYEDYIREGLEVPPSLGPNAIRSFALYFGISNGTTTTIPTTTYETTTTSSQDIIKQVDDLVHANVDNKTEPRISPKEDLLPNSLLTQHTRDSYSALFPNSAPENITTVTEYDKKEETSTPLYVGTTDFGSFTEEPLKINTELQKNDLDGSQSRGLVEPDPYPEDGSAKTSPDLRELAQVFTKALSAYLDDPEAFRKVLSEIRPTEPSLDAENGGTVQYPSAIKEDGEVLDFSDVTKSLYAKKAESTIPNQSATTQLLPEATTVQTNIVNEIENLILPINGNTNNENKNASWAINIELTAPLLESLDQSQSSYYTPPPAVEGTTNAIAEEINKFIEKDKPSSTAGNEVVDSYFPVTESPVSKFGGFHNNSRGTTKYSPYGAELTSSSTASSSGASPFTLPTTLPPTTVTESLPQNSTSFFDNFSKNQTAEEEIQLAKELNNLILLPKFTTPRAPTPEVTSSVPHLSTFHAGKNEVSHHQYKDIDLGNGEVLETNLLSRTGKALHISQPKENNLFNSAVQEINVELSPKSTTPKGFLITFSLESRSESQPATYLPKETTPAVVPTTYSPAKNTYFTTTTEPIVPTTFRNVEDVSAKIKIENDEGNDATTSQTTTQSFSGSTKSLERITELQETLMFKTGPPTFQRKDQVHESVQQMVGSLNMTESTANTLMKVMEMAAKNDTYRRLVLLLVNDKSGRNKTAEETRLSLLKALLTPVINVHHTRTNVPIPDPLKLAPLHPSRSDSVRRSKSIRLENSVNKLTTVESSPTTLPPTTVKRPQSSRRTKTGRNRGESNYRKSDLGNLGTIKRTIENSRSKQVKLNSIDDAIINSDSRAVELLRSLYSLAARWG